MRSSAASRHGIRFEEEKGRMPSSNFLNCDFHSLSSLLFSQTEETAKKESLIRFLSSTLLFLPLRSVSRRELDARDFKQAQALSGGCG